MNGPQDLGGQMGFGPIAPEPDEPLFHADWEKRALALTIASGALGAWTLDASRHARESLPPADYYGSSYYAIWIKALEALLDRAGLVGPDERAQGRALGPPAATPRAALRRPDVAPMFRRGGPVDRHPGDRPPRFARGDAVRARNMHPRGHTRLPRYVRGRLGRIAAVQGFHVLPDASAAGAGELPQWLYSVVFAGEELWGADGEPGLTVALDAWESYLEPA